MIGDANTKNSSGFRITPDMLKRAKIIECACGGMLFRQSIVFKKISAIISPSGKEEILPIDVMVCEKCGKVNNELMGYDILPDNMTDATISKIK